MRSRACPGASGRRRLPRNQEGLPDPDRGAADAVGPLDGGHRGPVLPAQETVERVQRVWRERSEPQLVPQFERDDVDVRRLKILHVVQVLRRVHPLPL